MQHLTFDLEDDYLLIGIHSTEDDYRLAYLINKNLNSQFTRYHESLDFKDSNAEFPLFEWKDKQTFMNYYLINNKFLNVINNQYADGLFGGNYSTTSYLIPEKKKVDFLLKIEGCNDKFALHIIKKLNAINQIITSYQIEANTLKSKNNLIF